MKKPAIFLVLLIFVLCASSCKTEKMGQTASEEQHTYITVYNGITGTNEEYFDYLDANYNIILNTPNIDFLQASINSPGVVKITVEKFKAIFESRHVILLSLNDFILENDLLRMLPNSVKYALADSDGVVWGLPYSHRFNTLSRVYNTSIMEQLNLSSPTNTDELFEVLLAVKNSYNKPVIRISKPDCVAFFYDVFAAFKCPIFDDKYTIGWSIKDDAFVDFAISDEMYKSLKYIKMLNDFGFINKDPTSLENLGDAYEKNELFTLVKHDSEGISDLYTTNTLGDSIIYLELGAENSPYVYILPNGIEKPEETLLDFISNFYSNEKINKSGRYGIEGKAYEYVDENFIIMSSNVSWEMPMISDYWFSNWYLPIKSVDEINEKANWLENNKALYVEGFYKGTYRFIPIEKTLALERLGLFDINDAKIYNKFSELFYKFLYENQSVEEFVLEYKKEIGKLGIEDYLDELNGR